MTIHQLLEKYWGYSHFRSLQEEIIRSVIDGNDTPGLMPTGGGKSVCFQVPATILYFSDFAGASFFLQEIERIQRPRIAIHGVR